MSLIDDLRAGIADIPPSHLPTAAEVLGIVGALVVVAEHGPEAFSEAAKDGHDGFVKLLSPESEEPADAPPDQAAADDTAALRARNAELEQQLQTALAAAGRTTTEPPAQPPPAPEPPPAV